MGMNFLVRFYFIALLFCSMAASFAEAQTEARTDNRKTIRAVIQSDSPPTYFKDRATGEAAGFAVDVMNAIAKRGGLSVTYQFEKNWNAIAPLIQSGKADVAPGQGITEDRKEIAAFTDPIGTFPVSIFVRAKDNSIADLKDVKIIGVTKGSSSSEILKKKHPAITIATHESNANGLMDLLSGRIDAFCTSATTLTQVAADAGLEDKIRIIGDPLSEIKRAIAVRKDNQELLDKLNGLIDEFSHTAEYKKLYTKWYGTPKPYWTGRKVLVLASLIAFFIIACMALWRYHSLALLNRTLEQNINERKKTEELILKAKEDWEETFNTITEAITIHDKDFNIIKSNKAAEGLLGLSCLNIDRHKCYEFYHGSDCPPQNCPSCKVLKTAAPSVTEIFEPHLNKHLEIKALPRLDKDGSLIGLIHVVRDITERKKAEEALLEHENFSKNLIQNSATATFVLDKTHRIMIWNKACEELTGCNESEMIGTDKQWQPFYDHKRPTVADLIIDGDFEDLPNLYNNSAKSSLNPDGITAEGWYKNLGGKDRYVIFETAPIFNSKGELIAAIETLQDITERKRLEEQLRQSQKLDAIGQLAGGVAHDFNNIITAIVGYSHLTLIKLEKNDPLKVNIEQILQASDRATTLTQSLLAFSRKQVINPKPNNLNEIVSGLHKFLLRLIREDIEIKMDCAREDLTVMADRGQIEQVVMNLVTNARDAMPKGGTIFIRTEQTQIQKDFIESHRYGRPGKYAVLMISDTGVGMDAKTREKIFEPFFTTKEQGKGTGLGLSMVYGIVSQHDGYIDVYSEAGKGTIFKIYIPLFRGPLEKESIQTESSPLKGGSETILIAEDDTVLRKMSALVLTNYGYSVIEAVDGEDAIAKYAESRDTVKLVMLDGIMPKKNGKEVYDEIRIINPAVKTLFFSGYAEDILSKEGLLDPDINFILKPVTPSVLLKKVRELLDE
ncbi:MAG: transporter substrate-binding domain-containing protein [Nitrospirae bacterium]|nr:MAG: transporter substrate-binding domain-containing protein [Nitrospirota bacterium]